MLWEATEWRIKGKCLDLFVFVFFGSILATCIEKIVRQRGNRRLGPVLYKRPCHTGLLGLVSALASFVLIVCPEWSMSGDSVAWMLHLVAYISLSL